MAQRSPDFKVSAMRKESKQANTRVGAAWINEDGTISLKLDTFIVLEGSEDLLVKLWPIEEGR